MAARKPARRRGKTGSTKAKDAWDVVVKVTGTLATAAGIIIGVWQYNSRNAEEKHMEFKRNMYARKLSAYEKVGQSVADLLTVPRDRKQYIDSAHLSAFDSCEKVFRQLYWGVLPLVEDTNVEQMMIRFGDQVNYYRRRE